MVAEPAGDLKCWQGIQYVAGRYGHPSSLRCYIGGCVSVRGRGEGGAGRGLEEFCDLEQAVGLLSYAQEHPAYLSDTTRERLHDAAEFDFYQQLGMATVLSAGPAPLPASPHDCGVGNF
jgi:hypothetical protein